MAKGFPKNVVDGFIEKGAECEFTLKCSQNGVACKHDTTIRYHCGYCKSFRLINYMKANADAGVETTIDSEIDSETQEE